VHAAAAVPRGFSLFLVPALLVSPTHSRLHSKSPEELAHEWARDRMIRDMTVRGFSPRTHEAYIGQMVDVPSRAGVALSGNSWLIVISRVDCVPGEMDETRESDPAMFTGFALRRDRAIISLGIVSELPKGGTLPLGDGVRVGRSIKRPLRSTLPSPRNSKTVPGDRQVV
jgi:hypothetical protein